MIIDEAGLKLRSLWIIAFFPIFFTIAGCSLLQIAPIQFGRVTQLETFTHTYYFGETKSPGGSSDTDDSKKEVINQRIEKTFTRLLGKANWQTIKDRYGFSDIRDELVDKSIYIKGMAQFYISIDPDNHQQFVLEGTGRYLLIRDMTNAIMLSGDFIVPPTLYRLTDLDSGLLSLDVILYTTRIPGEMTYYNEAAVKYQVKIDTSRKNDNIYRIDYDAIHDVYLLPKKGNKVTEENKFGELTFDNSELSSKKLLDLRGIEFLRSDY